MTNEWEQGVIVPIQIREDHWVRVGFIPHDLTPHEADRIAKVVTAYAQGTEAGTAETEDTGSVHDGPVAESDAPSHAPETRP